MKSIFEADSYKEIRDRLNNLSENSKREWGKMSHGQMLHHCQGPLNIMLEKTDYGMKPNWFVKLFFKKMMYNDKPFGKNMPTAKFLKESAPKDFKQEKATIESLLEEANAQRDKTDWKPHPGFGYYTAQQWGKIQYKHLDHHLRQFGV
ncbi:DUF1569 domain-containing protein [Ulvibacter litoralis]|uniref:DUF1569 domain-containing protein n=1 Tax=Ulvibacter litoralis TaxID=227084 RepID=A0A1G7BZM4_9FLAO|nr:DUF1569 domain-containing protein [Ulvibacter litoralis]GHC49190.1 hypothetical protein GCM10008083_10830 [Ulvibacter litoralis]SDE32522.1 Protein of unknown function [Ulvibacter litoralis]